MGHTPGPWRIHPFEGHVSAGDRLIANTMGHSNNADPNCRKENVANAHLIAAAPSLLECLETLKWKSVEKDNMEFECRTTCYVMDKIKAAIADAKGQDSSIYRGLPEQTQKALRDEKDEE